MRKVFAGLFQKAARVEGREAPRVLQNTGMSGKAGVCVSKPEAGDAIKTL